MITKKDALFVKSVGHHIAQEVRERTKKLEARIDHLEKQFRLLKLKHRARR